MTIADMTREDIDIGIDEECPICAKGLPFNAVTIAAIKEGRAMRAGKIPANRFHSFDEFWNALDSDSGDD